MGEEFKEPTYEEYKKANAFARIRYKYGLIVTLLCWAFLIFLIIYVFIHIEETKSNPIQYGIDKMKLKECRCVNDGGSIQLFVNATTLEPIRMYANYIPTNK